MRKEKELVWNVDMLPQEYEDVICCDANGILYVATFNSFGQFIAKSSEVIENVTAWMEAPEPYGREE